MDYKSPNNTVAREKGKDKITCLMEQSCVIPGFKIVVLI
jgi:hypothetical protein